MKYMRWSRIDLDNAYNEDIDAILEIIEEEALERERQKHMK